MQMTNASTMPVRTPDIVRAELIAHKDTSGVGWRGIACSDEWRPIPAGTLASIAKGDPIPYKWYRRLGIAPIVKTEACPECGEVHKIDGICIARSLVTITVVEMSAEEYAKVDKPVTITVRRHIRKDQRPRATINVADPASAARTIRRKMTPEILAALVDLLRGEE